MEARQVMASQGWRWIVGGFTLFRKSPIIWIVLCAILVVIWVVLAIIPFVGQLAFYLLSPVFVAGLMLGCRALEGGDELELSHLFAGFQNNTASLITVGGVYLVGQIIILGIIVAIGGGAIPGLMMGSGGEDAATAVRVSGAFTLVVLVGLALSIPLIMAIWFTPMLIVFNGMRPLQALKISFLACLRNILAFLVYGIAIFVLAIIAAIPLGLGFFILIPTIFTSIYESYKDIFMDTLMPQSVESA